jgi:hypothetical protein
MVYWANIPKKMSGQKSEDAQQMNTTQQDSINKNLTSVSSSRSNCSFIISVYVRDLRSGVIPPARTN